LSGIGEKRTNDLAQRLIRLAKQKKKIPKKDSAYVHGLKIAINNILSAEKKKRKTYQ
ncbi:IS110 family transposase, partial [Lactobacillus amylovorus]|nr:IS110 family transposase [Lactobacillus amylovorus]